MKRILFFCLPLTGLLAACTPATRTPRDIGATLGDFTTINILAAGAGTYYLYKDNWTVEHASTGPDRFRISLRKNTLRAEGDGEAGQLFKRQAQQLVTENGYDGYRILEYTEGIESASLVHQRVAQGVIECYRTGAPR